MADLKEIKGLNIPARASDPTNPVAGEIWYNTTTNVTKGRVYYNGVWSTGGATNTQVAYAAGFGASKDSAITASGFIQDVGGNKNVSEEYDGTSWTANPNMGSTLRNRRGAGVTVSAGLVSGGMSTTNTVGTVEEWNGSSWSGGGGLNTARAYGDTDGPQNSAGYVGGSYFPPGGAGGEGPAYTKYEEYNGSSWTQSSTLPYGAQGMLAFGNSSDDLLATGGLRYTSPTNYNITTSIYYNGTSWTAGGNINSSHRLGAPAGQSSTAAVAVAGSPGAPSSAGVETYDGTSWSQGNDINNGRYGLGGAGSSTSAVVFNGTNGDVTSPYMFGYTEEYNFGAATLTVSSS
jgi:hypothetical protein